VTTFAAHREHAGLSARREELQQIRQRDLVDRSRHRLVRARDAAPLSGLLQALARCLFAHGLGAVDGDQLDDRGADQDAVALFEARLLDLLAVDERTVRRAEVLDHDLISAGLDLCVLARDHVLDEHHVEVAGTPDDDLAVHAQGELSALVFPRYETQRKGGVGHA
jgi:hypothetical protein